MVNSKLKAKILKDRIIFIVGPNAVGKTEVAMELALKLNAEIISCDSMQIYKGMDVLSSSPALRLRRKIPHHLISCIKPDKEYNVAKYRSSALKEIRQILIKNKTPLFVGGSGHYMSVLIDGIFTAKAQNKALRTRLYAQAKRQGNQYLFERLKKIDPLAAAKIHPHDTKRIVRALEVFQTTGKPISELQKQRHGLWDKYDIRIFCLNMPADKLNKRLEARVDRMFGLGLVKEVKKLLKSRLSKTAAYAIGIRELKAHFDGLYNLEEAKALIKRNSRLYAKRQLTWFRKDKRIQWVNVGEKDKPEGVARRILSLAAAKKSRASRDQFAMQGKRKAN